jgi:hypothetical protein
MDNIVDVAEIKTSKKRIIGAAFFGFVFGGVVNIAFKFFLTARLSIVQEISRETAYLNLESSVLWSLIIMSSVGFFAAIVAGFISKKKGIFAGVISNIGYIFMGVVGFIFIIAESPDASYEAFQIIFLYLFLIFGVSIGGGFLGEKVYCLEFDLDLKNDKLTVFGIRWLHYFWILPLFLGFFISFLYFEYASLIFLLAQLYFIIHPSLWFKLSWWGYGIIVPVVGYVAIRVMLLSLIEFFQVIQYKQSEIKGWAKFWKVLLCGIVDPLLTCILAILIISATYALPQSVLENWQIESIVMGSTLIVLPLISMVFSLFLWVNKESVK